MEPAVLLCLVVLVVPTYGLSATPPSPEAVNLQRQLDAAIQQGSSLFTLPETTIKFNDAPFIVSAASMLKLQGGPTTLQFTPLSPGVVVNNSRHIHLIDLTIDYFPLPFVHGIITKVTNDKLMDVSRGQSVVVTLDSDSLTLEELQHDLPAHDTWPPMVTFNKTNREILCGACCWGRPPSGVPTGNPREYTVSVGPSNQVVGNGFAAPTRYGSTYTILNSTQVATENLVIRAASYMAIVEANGIGGHSYTNVTVESTHATAPLGSNADVFHSTGLEFGPLIQDCRFHNADDDFFNFHDTLQIARLTQGSHTAIVYDGQLFSGTPNTNYGSFQTFPYVEPGHILTAYLPNQLDNPIGNISVVKVQPLSINETVTNDFNQVHSSINAAVKACPLSACGAGLKTFANWQAYAVTFTHPLPLLSTPNGSDAYAFISNTNRSNIGARVHGSTFIGTTCNFGRIKSSFSQITDNHFVQSCAWNLETGPLQNFIEGTGEIRDVSIINNTFIGKSTSPIHTFEATVTATNNRFEP